MSYTETIEALNPCSDEDTCVDVKPSPLESNGRLSDE